MQKPNLDKLWEVWIPLDLPPEAFRATLRTLAKQQEWFNKIVDTIRSHVSEAISALETSKKIDWYYFLIHQRENDINSYFHIIFSLKEGVESRDFLGSLPSYCLHPKQLGHGYGESISGIEKSLLKNEEIEEAWKIIGEQSEWIIRMVKIHKDGEIPIKQFIQFMHFYMNVMGLGHLSRLVLSPMVFSF
jgi:hypothetical protein